MTDKQNQRREVRVTTALPVRLDKATGLTRDVSAKGVCFDVDADYATGSEISFVIELEMSSEKMLLNCKGRIVRTEDHGKKKGVAVEITESVMAAAN